MLKFSKIHHFVPSVLLPGLIVVALSFLYVWIYVSVCGFELPKTAILKKQHARWESEMNIIDRQIELYDITLSGIEDRDDYVYRSIFALDRIPESELRSGLGGGANRYARMEELGANEGQLETIRRMDDLMKRAYLRTLALDEVQSIAKTAGDMASHVPAVPPIYPDKRFYRLSSPYGGRKDPVYGRTAFHHGMDFAAHKGTPVYATADGVVVEANYQFRGYGNVIVIDHGFGYQTRYAHLLKSEVAEGMTVRRGEQIGSVGRSGKATGHHLHYEVIYRGRKVNPINYMDLSMSAAEYKAMADMRKSESRRGGDHRPTTTELLRRRK